MTQSNPLLEEGKQYSKEEFANILRQRYTQLEGIENDAALVKSTLNLFPEYKRFIKQEAAPVVQESIPQQQETKAVEPDWRIIESAEEVDEDDWWITQGFKEAGRIWNRAIASSELGQTLTESLTDGEVDFDELMYWQGVLKENARDADKDILTVDDGRNEILKFVVDVASTLPESAISQVNSMLTEEAAAAGAAGAATGAATGAAVGSLFAGVGAAPGALIGAKRGAIMGASGAASFINTYGSELMNELQKRGVDINDGDAVRAAFNNEELFKEANDTALTKAGVVGSVDALSAGLAGTFTGGMGGAFVKAGLKATGKKAFKATTEKGIREFAEITGQGALGGLGEGLGQWASGQEMDWRDIALEAAAEYGQVAPARIMNQFVGDKLSDTEKELAAELELRPEETRSSFNQAKIENAEEIYDINSSIATYREALGKAKTKEQKKVIKESINELQAKKNKIYLDAVQENKTLEGADVQEAGKLADEVLSLLESAQDPEQSAEARELFEKEAEAKAQKVKEVKERARKGINVSSRNFERVNEGAEPQTETQTAEGEAQPTEAEVQSNEMPDLPFDTEEGALTEEELFSEPQIKGVDTEGMEVVQKRTDSKGRNIQTVSSYQEDGNQNSVTTYSSFADGQPMDIGGVVFNNKDSKINVEEFLESFEISEKDKNDLKSAGVQEILLTESRTSDYTGSGTYITSHKVKYRNAEGKVVDAELYSKGSGLNLEGFEAYAEAEAGVQETQDADMSQAKEAGFNAVAAALSQLNAQIEEAKAIIIEDASAGEDVTAAEAALEELEAQRDKAQATLDSLEGKKTPKKRKPAKKKPAKKVAKVEDTDMPPLPFEEDVVEASKAEGVEPPKNAKRVKNALFLVDDKADAATKEKANDALTKDINEAGKDKEELSRWIAENAKQGDEIRIGRRLFRVEKPIEEKGESLLKQDIKTLKLIKSLAPTSDLRAALDVARRISIQESRIKRLKPNDKVELNGQEMTASRALAFIERVDNALGNFERGRFKGANNKKYNVGTLLTVIESIDAIGQTNSKAVPRILDRMRNSNRARKVKTELSKLNKKIFPEVQVLSNRRDQGLNEFTDNQIWNIAAQNILTEKEIGQRQFLIRENSKYKEIGRLASLWNTDPKLAEISKKDTDLISYLKDAGIETNTGNGGSRTVKMYAINPKTNLPYTKTDKKSKSQIARREKVAYEIAELQKKEKAEGLNEEEQDRLKTLLAVEGGSKRRKLTDAQKERNARLDMPYAYTAKIKDGAVTTMRNVDAILDNLKDNGILYTRFSPDITVKRGKVDVKREKYEKDKGFKGKLYEKVTDKEGNKNKVEYDVETYRPKSEKTLINALRSAFNLNQSKSEAAATITDRLITNMARRAGLKKSDIYNRITLVKGAKPTSSVINSILSKGGFRISESNIDAESGQLINYDKYNQNLKTPKHLTSEAKYKKNGVTDAFYAQTIKDVLDKKGIDLLNQKGNDVEASLIEAAENGVLSEILQDLREAGTLSLDQADIDSNREIDKMLRIEAANFFKLEDFRTLTEEQYKEYIDNDSENRSESSIKYEIASKINAGQENVNKEWARFFDESTISEDPLIISRAFQLVKGVFSGDYSPLIFDKEGNIFENTKLKSIDRDRKTVRNPAQFIDSVAAEVAQSDSDVHPLVEFNKMLIDRRPDFVDNKVVKKNSDGTFWARWSNISDMDADAYRNEYESLAAAVADSFWCTKTDSENQLKQGNFHVLFDSNYKPITAIREANGKIAEIRGNNPNQVKIAQYEPHLNEYLNEGFVAGGNQVLDANKLGELSAQYSENPDADINNPIEAQAYLHMISKNPDQTLLDTFIEKEGHKLLGVEQDEILIQGVNSIGNESDLEGYKVVVASDNMNLTSTEKIQLDYLILSQEGMVTFDVSRDFDTNEIIINNYSESTVSEENNLTGRLNFKVKPVGASKFGEVTYITVNGKIPEMLFMEGAGAVELKLKQGSSIDSIRWMDNIVNEDRIYRDYPTGIVNAMQRDRTISAQNFDATGMFEDILYQAMKSQSEKEIFLNQVYQLNGSNEFKYKKDAMAFVKQYREEFPSLKFTYKKATGIGTRKAGSWYIAPELKKGAKPVQNVQQSAEAQAAIAIVDAQAVIFALTNPNVSSPLHEMSHMYEDYLTPEEVKILEKWSGHKRDFNNQEEKTAFSEKFARGFERYLADGTAPTPELKNIFSQFKQWLKKIYNSIVGSDIDVDITPEVRKIFDTMVMVEGDVNFNAELAAGEAVGGRINTKVLEQRNIKGKKGYSETQNKFEKMMSNSENKILAANQGNKKSFIERVKKQWSDRQSNIRKRLMESESVVAEAAMVGRAGAAARGMKMAGKWEKKVYDGLDIDAERTLNKLLQAERILQIESNREANREMAIDKIQEFQERRDAIMEASKGLDLNEDAAQVVNDSLDKIDRIIKKYEKLYDKNRLYKIDENGNETGELAFKHPNGITREEAEQFITEISKRKDYDKIRKSADAYFESMNEVMKDMYDNGIVNEETYNRFKDQKYISRQFLSHLFDFQYDMDGQVMKVDYEKNADFYNEVGLGEGVIKSLEEGSEGDLIVDSRYLMEAAFKATSIRVAKNRANTALAKSLEGKNVSWFRDANYEMEGKDIVEDEYGNRTLKSADKGFHNVFYRENGQLRGFQLDNESFNEWNDLERKLSMPDGVKNLRKASGVGVLKAMATGYNPLFFLANVPMDMAHVLFFTDIYDNNKLLPVNFIRATKGFMKNTIGLINADRGKDTKAGKLLDIYIDNGGMMDFMTQQGQETLAGGAKHLKGVKKRTQFKEKAGKVLGYTGNVTELAMRLTSMENVIKNLKAERKAGKNSYTDAEINQIAVAKARKTMDFAQGGLSAKQVDNFVPYFNAAVQGFRVSREYLSTKSGRANFANKWMQASVAVAGLMIYNLLQGEDEDDNPYDDIPDYIKDNYFIILNPFSRDEDGRMSYIRIRKTPTLAPLLNLSEAIARSIFYTAKGIEDPRGSKSTVAQFQRALNSIETTLPFVPTPQGVASKMPPTVQAAVKYISNYDPFRQMNIVPKNEINEILPKTEGLGDERVPYFMKAMGEVFGLSPKRATAAMESVITSPSTNGMVAMGYAMADMAAGQLFKPEEFEKSKYSGSIAKSFGGAWDSSVERVYRKTNPNWRDYSYEESQRIRMAQGTERYTIKKNTDWFAKNKDLEGFKDYLSTVKITADKKYAVNRFKMYMKRDGKVKNLSKNLDVVYTRDPEASAKIFGEYFEVYNIRDSKQLNQLKNELRYLYNNFGWKPSSRWYQEYERLSKEKYKF